MWSLSLPIKYKERERRRKSGRERDTRGISMEVRETHKHLLWDQEVHLGVSKD